MSNRVSRKFEQARMTFRVLASLRRNLRAVENNYDKLERAREFPRWPSVKAAGGLCSQLRMNLSVNHPRSASTCR